jgi:hypothetical protein
MTQRRFRAAAAGVVGLAVLVVAPAASAATTCPTSFVDSSFATEEKLRQVTKQEMSFGLRLPASQSHNQMLVWLEDRLRRIRGLKVKSDPFFLQRWQPRPRAKKHPSSRDMGRAGGLKLARPGAAPVGVPVAGPVPFSRPTNRLGSAGPLVYLPRDQEITPENAAGKVVIRDFPAGSIPNIAFQLLSLYITPDLASESGNYERPYLQTLDEELIAAGRAGAAGVIYAFDVPREQVRGYFDPHNGTHFRVPAVFVGADEAAQLKAAAGTGQLARVVVKAERERAKTRNLIATLRGGSRERIVLAANTDGNTWVQENGVVGVLEMARYFANLPKGCRPRDIQFVFGTSHLHISREGTHRYVTRLDPQYDFGTVAFAFVLEHLGTREILPVPDSDGSGRHLEFTGRGEPFLWAVGPSPALRREVVNATQGRSLDHIAVLRGAGAPVTGQAPTICSFGGIGTTFHTHLIPTMAMISGPWSLWAPAFGSSAIDFARMHRQLLAAGDALAALQGAPSAEIAGDYPMLRAQRAAGAPTCDTSLPPQEAPGPGQ